MVFALQLLWLLPNNVLGFLFWFCNFVCGGAKLTSKGYWEIAIMPKGTGCNIGHWIFGGKELDDETLKHEKGHRKQSIYAGAFALLFIGLPSFLCFWIWKIFKLDWAKYMSLPWEAEATRLGRI